MSSSQNPTLGVVVVTYCSAEVIQECLESLLASTGVSLRVVVVDNASPDRTMGAIVGWADGSEPFVQLPTSPVGRLRPRRKPLDLVVYDEGQQIQRLGTVTIIRARANLGFAGGVNLGLQALSEEADLFWILNPDCVAPSWTAKTFVDAAIANPGFGLMGGRSIYYDQPDRIQTDGGIVKRLTGVCIQVGYGEDPKTTAYPKAENLDWLSGASLVVSGEFVRRNGPMREDYFLYFEEVDWAFRRGDMRLVVAEGAVVYHHGGTSIGTGSISRRASAFANYFNHRNRLRFARRFLSRWPLGAYVYGLLKAMQLVSNLAWAEAYAVVAGMFELAPPKDVRARIKDPASLEMALRKTS